MPKGSKYDDNAADARGVALYGFLEGTTDIVPVLVDADGNVQTKSYTSVCGYIGEKSSDYCGNCCKISCLPPLRVREYKCR